MLKSVEKWVNYNIITQVYNFYWNLLRFHKYFNNFLRCWSIFTFLGPFWRENLPLYIYTQNQKTEPEKRPDCGPVRSSCGLFAVPELDFQTLRLGHPLWDLYWTWIHTGMRYQCLQHSGSQEVWGLKSAVRFEVLSNCDWKSGMKKWMKDVTCPSFQWTKTILESWWVVDEMFERMLMCYMTIKMFDWF